MKKEIVSTLAKEPNMKDIWEVSYPEDLYCGIATQTRHIGQEPIKEDQLAYEETVKKLEKSIR